MLIRREHGCFFVFVVYVCVVGTTFVSLLGRVQVWMPLPETLCECCGCECVCVCFLCVCEALCGCL